MALPHQREIRDKDQQHVGGEQQPGAAALRHQQADYREHDQRPAAEEPAGSGCDGLLPRLQREPAGEEERRFGRQDPALTKTETIQRIGGGQRQQQHRSGDMSAEGGHGHGERQRPEPDPPGVTQQGTR